jgi:hypothetical protein
MQTESIWFPEPSPDNASKKQQGRVFDWLSCSTEEEAVIYRRFLNANFLKIPETWRENLYSDFRTKEWQDVFFELFVARTLQILGGFIEVEVPNEKTGKRPDFIARFPNNSIVVEATVKKTNLTFHNQIRQNRDELCGFIEPCIPVGWTAAIWKLPKIGPSDSKEEFKKIVRDLLSKIPEKPSSESEPISITYHFSTGELRLNLLPYRRSKAIVSYGFVTGSDDTAKQIPKALRQKSKKGQVREADYPVILAISSSSMNDELEDYDEALKVFHRRASETYAGVMVFTSLSYRQVVPDPVLYLNPSFSGMLPPELYALQSRTYSDQGVVITTPAMKRNVLAPMYPHYSKS